MSLRFMESPATEEEDACGWRIEWDEHITFNHEVKKYGPGSTTIRGFDNAWDAYCDRCDTVGYRGLRLIQIYPDGTEIVHSKK